MSDHTIYSNDLLARNSGYSFTELLAGNLYTVTFKDGSSVTQAEQTGLTLIDAYRKIRSDVLDAESPAFMSTTTQRDALTSVDTGTVIDNTTTGHLEIYNGTAWNSVAQESNTTGITASTTQTQAGGTALTSQMNFIETVANENDAVTLQSVSNGDNVTIINDGANTVQIFPATGDDLGNGTNASTHLETHEEITFWGKNSTNWHIRYTSESFHASMYEQDNTTEFVIHAANEAHAYHSANIVEGDLGSWTYNAGSAGASVAISSIAEINANLIEVTTDVAHGISVGDIVCQTALTDSNYVGFFTATVVPTTTTYYVATTWTATGTGFVDRPAYLTVKDIATGFYNLEWASTMQIAGSGVTLAFDLHDGMSTIVGSKAGYKFASTSTIKQPNGLGEKIVSSGDRIFFTITNETDATNITVKHLKIRLEHI